MYRLEVVADKLNIRNSPQADPAFENWIGDMNKGEIFTAARRVRGGLYDGSDEWYVDNLNRFIASGLVGVNAQDYISSRFTGGVVTEAIDYSFLLNINASIKNGEGRGVTIAIMDHPIRRDIQLKNEIHRPFGVGDANPQDSHGGFIAGIIGGVNNILGISPSATVIELPIYDAVGNIRPAHILDRIFEFIASRPGKIILNVSQSLEERFLERFAVMRNAIIVAAAGVDDMLLNGELVIPARLNNTISVGAVKPEFKDQYPATALNNRLDVVLPVFDYVSNSLNAEQHESGQDTSSFATAVVSSIIALLYSDQIITDSTDLIRQRIFQLSQSYTDQRGFNFLNPIKLS